MKAKPLRCLNMCVAAILMAAPRLSADISTATTSAWEQSLSLEQQGDYKGALTSMEEFAGQSGDPYLVQLRSGWLAYRSASYEKAAQAYQAASLLAPGSIAPLLGLASSARALGQLERAASACQRVLSIDPANYTAAMMLGGIYYEHRNYSGARPVYAMLEKTYPEDAAALSAGSWTLLNLGIKRDAADGFHRLLQMYPSYPYAQQGYQAAAGNNLFKGALR